MYGRLKLTVAHSNVHSSIELVLHCNTLIFELWRCIKTCTWGCKHVVSLHDIITISIWPSPSVVWLENVIIIIIIIITIIKNILVHLMFNVYMCVCVCIYYTPYKHIRLVHLMFNVYICVCVHTISPTNTLGWYT